MSAAFSIQPIGRFAGSSAPVKRPKVRFAHRPARSASHETVRRPYIVGPLLIGSLGICLLLL